MAQIDSKKGKAIAIFYMVVYCVLLVLTWVYVYLRYNFETEVDIPRVRVGLSTYTVLLFLFTTIIYSIEIGMAVRLFKSFQEGKRYLYQCWRKCQIWYCVIAAITGILDIALVVYNYDTPELNYDIFVLIQLEAHYSLITAKRIILSVYIIDILVACPLGITLIKCLFDKYDQERQTLEPPQGEPQQGMAWNGAYPAAPGGGYNANGYPGNYPQGYYPPQGNYYPPGSVPPGYSQQAYNPAQGNYNSAPGSVPPDYNQKENVPA